MEMHSRNGLTITWLMAVSLAYVQCTNTHMITLVMLRTNLLNTLGDVLLDMHIYLI